MGRVRANVWSLLAGVCLAVASAWALAALGWFTDGELMATYDERNTQVPPELVPVGWDIRSWHYSTGPGIRRDLVSECEWMGSTLGMTMDGRPQRTIIHIRVGWPCMSMTWWDYRSPQVAATGVQRSRLVTAWNEGVDIGLGSVLGPGGRFGVARKVPIRPLWIGLAVNALVFAFAAFAGVRGVAAIRRARRRKRGQCETCAYPVAELPACPECGVTRTIKA